MKGLNLNMYRSRTEENGLRSRESKSIRITESEQISEFEIVKAIEGSGTVEDHHHTTQLVLTQVWVAFWPCKWLVLPTRLWHTGVPSDRGIKLVTSLIVHGLGTRTCLVAV
ncbi:E3 ubiquitin-protein ligase UPL3-like protein [Gossypium australe]|uniref:E3 ubiquitin-protein ligase UPL3-like protein n=1 Tax=Gossypium australe TaxID=47621 RepID=A0A5B6X492_9ROSI|nr:E3 ubiquitin-protein ligase UPL3-like protein [Gossypium australe]